MVASGGYAEFSTASATAIAKKPDGVSHEQAAAIPVAGITAWQALFDRGGLGRGQSALIAGAAGGVGHFAVQFASQRACGPSAPARRATATSCSGSAPRSTWTTPSRRSARRLTAWTSRSTPSAARRPPSLLPAVREGGILVTIAAAPPEEAAQERGVRAELLVMSPSSEQLAHIAELVAAGDVRVEIAEAIPSPRSSVRTSSASPGTCAGSSC